MRYAIAVTLRPYFSPSQNGLGTRLVPPPPPSICTSKIKKFHCSSISVYYCEGQKTGQDWERGYDIGAGRGAVACTACHQNVTVQPQATEILSDKTLSVSFPFCCCRLQSLTLSSPQAPLFLQGVCGLCVG